MALATQCPHCLTTFRVVQDQLKLRAGLVRCGSCREIFNGLEHLLHADGMAPITPASIPTIETPEAVTDAQQASHAPTTKPPPVIASTPEPDTSADFMDFFGLMGKPTEPSLSTAPVAEPIAETTIDPLRATTLIAFIEDEPDTVAPDGQYAATLPDEAPLVQQEFAEEKPDAFNRLVEDEQGYSLSDEPESTTGEAAEDSEEVEHQEPYFLTSGRKRERTARKVRLLMTWASCALSVAMVVQTTYLFRNQIAARIPQVKPLLDQACSLIGCRVGLPAQIDEVSIPIESTELQIQDTNKGSLVFNSLLRNRSQTVQEWPHIELTLNDANLKVVARRVVAPRDYLPAGQDPAKGLAAASEQPIRFYFELVQLKATGYVVYPFYP